MSVANVGYRLSPQQKRAWQLLLANNGGGYLVEGALLIEGGIDSTEIEELLDNIVQRHEILRTGYKFSQGATIPIQIIYDRRFRLDNILDLSHMGEKEREAEIERLRQEARRRFPNLEQDALMQTTLIVLSAEKKLLIVSLPAICSDRAGVVNLAHELGRGYSARPDQILAQNGTPQYADIAGVLNNLVELDEMQDGREYWRTKIEPELFDIRLPHLTSTTARQEFFPRSISHRLGYNLSCYDGEGVCSPSHNTSACLQACYAALLYKLTGSPNLLIGTAFAVRGYEELADTIGPLEKYLPIHCQIEPGTALEDLERQISNNCIESEAWQESFTWDDVKRVSENDQEPPFFPFQFEYWDIPETISTSSVRVTLVDIQSHRERFDLKLCCVKYADALEIQVHYNGSVLGQGTAAGFCDELITLIQSADNKKKEAIDRLNILSRREKKELLTVAAGLEAPLPNDEYVHELIDRNAHHSVAVIFEEMKLSYENLAVRSNQLARYLQSLGVGEGIRVGIYQKRSPDIIVSILGILKSGGVYVPLDPEYPKERLTHIMNDAEVRIVLTQADLAGRLPDVSAVAVRLDCEWEDIASQSDERIYPDIFPESLAYVIYTSGSTGAPKGVGVSHRNLLSSTLARLEFYGGLPDRFLLLSPFPFDSSVAGIFWTLLAGGTLVLPPENTQREPKQITNILAWNHISHTLVLPSLYQYVLEAADLGQTSCLHTVIVAGEACSSNLPRLHRIKAANARLFNEYGPTECAVWSTACACGVESVETKVPIGKPIANTYVYVLDKMGELAPMGVPGELFVGGSGVARGYLNQAALTAERFVPNPFGCQAGERMYRTGDQVRWRGDKELEFLGRIDHQVKIRGYRIELEEIEAVLNGHRGVKQCVVVAEEDERGDKRLIAYVVSEAGTTSPELKAYLRERLPGYMVPEAILALESMPVTANGKIDRKRLPSAKDAGGQLRHEYIGARNPIEEIFLGIFEEVLKRDQVSITDSFFEIGGHSLLATQVVSRVRDAFGVEMSVRWIFDNPTAEGLARRIEEAMREGERLEVPPLVKVLNRERLPLSFAQQRLWFLDQLVPNNPFYNLPGGVKLDGKLDHEALERVINEMVRRHEVLRTRIEVWEGEPVQVIDEWERRRLEVEDLTNLPPEEREEKVRRIVQEDAENGFDLSRGPLIRVKVLKVEEEEHVVLFTMHHIVSDGWSMGVLIKEVGTLFKAYAAGEESPLEELEIQYADYAVWQREYLSGGMLEREVGYWREQLKGAAVMDLPTDYTRPAASSYRGSKESIGIGKEVTEGLRSLVQREGATMFMVLMAAFKILLMRYSGESDVSVGTVIANRTRKEVEGVIGFFVNTLVLRTDLGGNPSFRELIKREREVALCAYAHQEVPFEKLVEEINPERDLGRSPLFQVMMALHNIRQEALEISGLKMSGVGEGISSAKFDLTLALVDGKEGISGSLEYSRDLYEGETAERMVRHFEKVVAEVVRDAGQRIREIELLSEGEKREIVVEWNQTRIPYPQDRSIHELFAEQAGRESERIALISGRDWLSYSELNRRANQLGNYLQRLGVGPEARVALCLERSIEMVVAVMGVLKAGGGYLPLDPEYPLERLSFMLEDASVGLVLTRRALESCLPIHWGHTVLIDEEWEKISEESESEPVSEVMGENLAYILYTSGSSGRPKGVAVSHRAVLRLVVNTDYVRLDRDSCLMQLAPMTFDAATFEIWGALLHGGKLVMAEMRAPGAKELGQMIGEYGVETMWLTASLYNAVVDEGVKELSGLRQLLIGGEALSVSHVRVGVETLKDTKLINGYGPTEGTTFTCCQEIRADAEAEWRGGAPIGRAIANTKVYVMDEWMGLSPVGVQGELYIGGDGLARGYHERAEMTAEKFIPHPYSEGGGERLYRSGDIVRYLSDGKIEFIGRADEQVKIRGYRIELGEIEALLNEHRGVRQSVVVADEHERGDKRLLGYVVTEGGVTAAELKKYLRERAPDYMAPEAILMLDEMPLTANGKIDRKRLPLLKDVERARGAEYVGAQTPIEEILEGIFNEVLKFDRVGRDDNFFEIGGHSLLATQVISRVRKVFGVDIGVGSIFENATVAGLASRIEGAIRAGDKIEAPQLVRVSREERLPLSFAQQRLWFLDQLVPNNPFYNCAGSVGLEGRLDLEILERVINEIVRRHEVLRTRFEVEEDEPMQVIDEWAPRSLDVLDLTSMTDGEREEDVGRITREEAETGFNLRSGPLLRVKMLKLGEEEHVALFTLHHIVSDAWSMKVLFREVSKLYEAISEGKQSPLPELEIQYADYAYWQRNYLRGDLLKAHLEYWKKQLGGKLPVVNLAGDRPRSPTLGYRGATKSVPLPAALYEPLKALSKREGVTMFMVLLAAFKTLLYRYTAQEDIIVGTAALHRDRAEIEPLIGFFVNMLPMRTDLSGNPRFRELLKRVKEVALGAYAHQETPFEMLVEEIQPERELGQMPLFNIAFGVQNTAQNVIQSHPEEGRFGGLKIKPVDGAYETARFDLSLWVTESANALEAAWTYSATLFEEETIMRMHRHFETLLSIVVDRPDALLDEIDILSEAERAQQAANRNLRQEYNYGRFKNVKPKAIVLSED